MLSTCTEVLFKLAHSEEHVMYTQNEIMFKSVPLTLRPGEEDEKGKGRP